MRSDDEKSVLEYAIIQKIDFHMKAWEPKNSTHTQKEFDAEVAKERARLEESVDDWFIYDDWEEKYKNPPLSEVEKLALQRAIDHHVNTHMAGWLENNEYSKGEEKAEAARERARLEESADDWFVYERWK